MNFDIYPDQVHNELPTDLFREGNKIACIKAMRQFMGNRNFEVGCVPAGMPAPGLLACKNALEWALALEGATFNDMFDKAAVLQAKTDAKRAAEEAEYGTPIGNALETLRRADLITATEAFQLLLEANRKGL